MDSCQKAHIEYDKSCQYIKRSFLNICQYCLYSLNIPIQRTNSKNTGQNCFRNKTKIWNNCSYRQQALQSNGVKLCCVTADNQTCTGVILTLASTRSSILYIFVFRPFSKPKRKITIYISNLDI